MVCIRLFQFVTTDDEISCCQADNPWKVQEVFISAVFYSHKALLGNSHSIQWHVLPETAFKSQLTDWSIVPWIDATFLKYMLFFLNVQIQMFLTEVVFTHEYKTKTWNRSKHNPNRHLYIY